MTFFEALSQEAAELMDDFSCLMNTNVTHKIVRVECQDCGHLNKIDRGLKVKDIALKTTTTVAGVVLGASIGSHSGLAIMGQKAVKGTIPMGIVGGALGSSSGLEGLTGRLDCAKCGETLKI